MNYFFLLMANPKKDLIDINVIGKSELSVQEVQKKSKFQFPSKTGIIYLIPSFECEKDGKNIFQSVFLSHDTNKYNPNSYTNQYNLSKLHKHYFSKKGIECYFVCFLINKKNEVIPVGIFHPYKGSFEDENSFYFSVLEPAQGLGIATAIAQGFINALKNWRSNPNSEYYNDVKHVKRIETSAHYENTASCKVFQKLGFKQSEIMSVVSFVKGYKFTKEI